MLVILLKKKQFNSKITEVESKIHSITGLATHSALTAVENKITDVSSLVKKKIMKLNCKTLVKVLLQIKQSICLLKMN